MHQSCRTVPPGTASLHLKGAGPEAGRSRPISDPSTSTNEGVDTTLCPPKKLYRKNRNAMAPQPGARAVSNPFHFGISKRTTPPAFTPSKSELVVVDASESELERRRSFEATFSVLHPWHGRDSLESGSSTSIEKSGSSTSASEDGEAVEPGSESVPATQKRQHSHLQTSTTDHVTGLYSPSVR